MTFTRRLVPALIMGGLLALTACATGTDDSDIASANGDPGADPTPTSTLSPEEQAIKYVACMREHGIPMDDPQFSDGGAAIGITADGIAPDEMEAAAEACREFAPFGGDRPEPDPEMEEKFRQFAQCMRDNGVPDFPDPDGGGLRIDAKVTGDPDFEGAQSLCAAQFLPDLPPPNTGGGGPGTGPVGPAPVGGGSGGTGGTTT